MSRHQKELTQKQKIIIYISCAAAAIICAVIATIIIVGMVKNPPAVIFNSNSASYVSNLSTSSQIFVPDATVTVTPEGKKQDVEDIAQIAGQVEPTDNNKVIVPQSTIDKSGFVRTSVKIPVAYVPQNPELPTGCEITSLTTVLNFYGYNVSKTEMADKYLDKALNRVGDFWEVFVGDPRKNGFGCYAKPIVNAANRYLATQDSAYKAVNYSGTKFEDLLKIVETDTPVIIWSTMYSGKTRNLLEPYTTVKWNINGKNIQWIAPEHCMVLIGYDLDRNIAILSDPQRGIVEYDLGTVKSRYMSMHSQCVVLVESPVITGVEDGATYYSTQCATVSNQNFDSVTLNGQKCSSSFLIPGNVNDTYQIVVTDCDGKTKTITVYTKTILSLLDSINGITEYNVTINHQKNIQDVKNSILALDSSYSPTEEKKSIEDAIASCDLLLKKIENTTKEFTRIKVMAENYNEGQVNADDATVLIKIIEDIHAITAAENLTDEQKIEISTIKLKCEQLLLDIHPTESNIPDNQ